MKTGYISAFWHILIVSLFINLSTFMAKSAEPFRNPDFAYPQTVEANAEEMLKKADRQNGTEAAVTRIRAMLELVRAKTYIDPDQEFSMPSFIAAQTEKIEPGTAGKALTVLLEAQSYSDIYFDNSWKYDKVDAPLRPFPADVSEWSGDQFRFRIDSLLTEAVRIADAAPAVPLAYFSACVTADKIALEYFPTVEDFVRLKNFQIRDLLGRGESRAPLLAAETALKASKEGSPAYFYWAVEKNRLENNISGNDSLKELKALYSRWSDNEAARFLLINLGNNAYSYEVEMPYEESDESTAEAKAKAARDSLISEIKSSLERFPSWYGNNNLRNQLAVLERSHLIYYLPPMVAPGVDFDVKLKYSYATDIVLELYPLPSPSDGLSPERIAKRGNPLQRRSVRPDKTDGETTLRFNISQPGRYAIIGKLDGVTMGYPMPSVLVTPFVPFSVNNLTKGLTGTVDFVTGAPLAGVTVASNIHTYRRNSGADKNTTLGNTGSNGMLTFNNAESAQSNASRYLSYTYKGRKYDFNKDIRSNPYRNYGLKEYTTATVFTDRGLYHPGDSIRWAVIAYHVSKDMAPDEVLEQSTVTVILKDANYQTIDTVTVKTDALGRANGTFTIPKGQLTGNYTLTAQPDGGNIASSRIMVSDFKLPTFEVAIDKISRDVPEKGDITLSGVATTYSGMPVADAAVKLKLTGAMRWRWFSPERELGRFEARTGVDGRFSIILPSDTLSAKLNYGRPYTDFIAEAVVTSTANEAQSVSRSFTTGKPYYLDATTKTTVVDTSHPVAVSFTATDADGKEGAIAMRWALGTVKNGKLATTVATGSAIGGRTENLDLSAVPAGEYCMQLMPDNSALADTTMSSLTLTLYNESAGTMPSSDNPLFLPQREYTIDKDKTEILIGIRSPKAYLFCIESEGSSLIRSYVKELKAGFHRLEVGTKDRKKTLTLQLVTVKDGCSYNESVDIKQPTPQQPEIIAESFRDKLVPGSSETWRFRFVDSDGKGIAGAAMMATMYNRALDELSNFTWPTLGNIYPNRISSWISMAGNAPSYFSVDSKIKTLKETSLQLPEWMFSGISNFRIRGTRMMKYAAAMPEAANDALEESEMVTTESVTYDSAAGAVKEEAVEDMAAPLEEKSEAKDENFDYRVSEVLQALWNPSLTSDAEGNIDLTFVVPNAIGSWQLRAFAWSRDLRTASYMAQCIANKPVMVQSNLPRFLRQGDKARVLATVFNNTDSVQNITSVVEIFDVSTGKTIDSTMSTASIAANGSTLVSADITAPVDAASIGYRVRVAAGNFSDGEQALIPVLSTAATVIESTEFYLNPDTKEPYVLTLPAADDAVRTLQYCQNPIWTIVKAMRGIHSGSTTSNGLSGELFSALAARKIVGSNPDIAAALRTWKDNPSENALKSMLSKNEDLKKLLLGETPWVQMASDQTSRMEALTELLEPDKAEAAIKATYSALAKLQNRDGGFAWGPWRRESSVWATENVLTTIALANSLDMNAMPTDKQPDLQAAFDYLQKEATRADAPKTDSDFALIAALMPQLKTNVAGTQLIRRTVAEIASKWKKAALVTKAYDILILNANGRSALAGNILESIRQFGVEKEGMGLCFPSVNDVRSYATIIQAYAAMGAPAKEIDAMRQWLIVRAQASDNLGAYNPDYVIAGILMTGSDWTSVPVSDNVTVDGKALEINSVERPTGYFSTVLPDSNGKAMTLSIATNGITPSYGSVVSVGKRVMTEVEARPGRDLSIEKRFLVLEKGEWKETRNFKAGQTVRVQLVIKAKRDLQYVSIDDERAATFEPVDQLPGYVYDGSLAFYRENLDASTRLFLGWLPKGTYHVTYDMTAAQAGSFSSGIATLQSQYAPELTAHSGGCTVTVE